jgi:G3E family GTPase
MAEIPKTPIMLITGSLGSGKTTLLRRILDYASLAPAAISQAGNLAGSPGSQVRIAVLMNEFGELAIDSRVISGENIDIIELAGGCVCCSMTGEFEAAVKEIIETIGPDFIVVEATGVAESDALVFEVEDNLPEVRLDSVVCIVDAYLGIKYPHVGYTSRTQIASADIILINKADMVTQAEAETVEAQTRKYNERAAFLRTVNCGVDTRLLFGPSPAGAPARRPAGKDTAKVAKAHAPDSEAASPTVALHSFVWTTEKTLDREKFDCLVRELPEELIRAKGFVRFEDGGCLFNYVAGRVDFEEFNADRTELVFIGSDLDRLRQEIENGLLECERER